MYKSIAAVAALSVALTCAAAKSAAHVPLPPSNPLKNTEQEKGQNSKPANVLFSERNFPVSGRQWQLAIIPAVVFKEVLNSRPLDQHGK